MDIYGAKFQVHCLNNSRDIVYLVFTTFQLQYYDIITDLICIIEVNISKTKKNIFQKEKRHSSIFWKAFQISSNYLLCHIHLKKTSEDTNFHRYRRPTLLSFKTRIQWPPVLTATTSFPSVFFNSCNIQGNVQAFRLAGLLWWQKLSLFFQHSLQDL